MHGLGHILIALLVALLSVSSMSARVPTMPKPLVQDMSLAKPTWIFHRKFSYKKDQKLNGPKRVDVRPNQTFEIPTSREKGFWEVEVRSDGGGTTDYWVLSIPQDEDQETLITYEIAVSRGRFQPTSVRFAPEGSIYLIDRTVRRSKDAEGRDKMKIGSFRVDMKTLPPIVDRAFTSYNK